MKFFCLSCLIILGLPLQATGQVHTDSTVQDTASEQLFMITAAGDLMLGTNYPNTGYLPPDDGRYLLDSVKSYIREADLAFVNLEGTYLNSRGPTSKKCRDPKTCYAFRSPEHYLGYVKDAGFDLVSLANNHSGDFGVAGRERTMALADSLGLVYAGLENCPFRIFEKDGLRIGFAAFAPNSGCVQLNDLNYATAIIDTLNEQADLIIVSFHGGAEGSKYQHVAKGTEYFLGENRGNLRLFAHTLIDHGADLILGHGPHVTRGMEVYKDRLIAYSLGNFATYGRFNLSGPNGVCPLLQIMLTREGRFQSATIIPIRQYGEGIPMVDPDGTVLDILRRLSDSDFPESAPVFIEKDVIVRRRQ